MLTIITPGIKAGIRPSLASFLLCSFLTLPVCATEVRVDAIGHGLDEPVAAGGARCLRFSDGVEVDLIAPMLLYPGDEIWSDSESIDVRLECGEQTVQLLSGRFRAFVDFPGDKLCAIKLARGALDVLTDSPIQTDVGGIVLGNEGTQYAVRLAGNTGALAEVLVFDGTVRASAPGQSAQIRTGAALELGRSGRLDGAERRLTEHDLERSAGVYARTDLAVSRNVVGRLVEPRRDYQELERLHRKVLGDPGSREARAALAKAQIRLGVNDDAFYHLKHGNLLKKKRLKRNGIDREELERRLSPGNRAALEGALKKGGFGKALGTALVIGAGAILVHEALDDDDDKDRAPATCDEINRLLDRQDFDQAVSRASQAIKARQASSCHYYAAAKGRQLAEDAKGRSRYCQLALTAHERDSMLRGSQIEDCSGSSIR